MDHSPNRTETTVPRDLYNQEFYSMAADYIGRDPGFLIFSAGWFYKLFISTENKVFRRGAFAKNAHFQSTVTTTTTTINDTSSLFFESKIPSFK